MIDEINKFIEIAEVWKLNRSLARALFCSLPLHRALLLSPLRNFFVRSSLASSEALVLRQKLSRCLPLSSQNLFVRSSRAVLLSPLRIYSSEVLLRQKLSRSLALSEPFKASASSSPLLHRRVHTLHIASEPPFCIILNFKIYNLVCPSILSIASSSLNFTSTLFENYFPCMSFYVRNFV